MRMTEEEKVAEKISNLLSDLRLDLEKVGVAISELAPWVIVNRIALMAEIAKEEKENARRHFYNL